MYLQTSAKVVYVFANLRFLHFDLCHDLFLSVDLVYLTLCRPSCTFEIWHVTSMIHHDIVCNIKKKFVIQKSHSKWRRSLLIHEVEVFLKWPPSKASMNFSSNLKP